ncbi:MAG: DUF4340 domain-containing protein [Thiotrichaceae bacterium]|nr:DUF4340 domain-containing protein [Thiotrichaceae bacterium]
MSKAAKTNLILFLACVGLFLIAWLQPGLHKDIMLSFTDLRAEQLHTIVIQRSGLESVKMVKKEAQWWLIEPEQARANSLRVATITALAEKRSYAQFHAEDEDLQRYQLKDPKVSVWLNDKQFAIGAKHPVKELRYAMAIDMDSRSSGHTIHLIDDKVFYQLRSNLDTFIHKVP